MAYVSQGWLKAGTIYKNRKGTTNKEKDSKRLSNLKAREIHTYASKDKPTKTDGPTVKPASSLPPPVCAAWATAFFWEVCPPTTLRTR